MKLTHLLSLAASATAFVVPNEEIFANLVPESPSQQPCLKKPGWYEQAVAEKDHLVEEAKHHIDTVKQSGKDAWDSVVHSYHQTLDQAYEYGGEVVDMASEGFYETTDDVQAWLEETTDEAARLFERPHRPHHPPHETNLTVYQLIAGSKYTTKLAKLINEYGDLVEALNSTKANYTVFAPTDAALEKIPPHHMPSKEILKKILEYHVVPDVYSAARVLASHTAPTLLKSSILGKGTHPQRIAFKLGLRGLTINFYSRVVAINVFGTNGVVHGVDSIILPPPSGIQAIDLFPGEFSTLELALAKTGLLDTLNTTKHAGGTLFAPDNFAFQKLGPRINAFLFSKFGKKYLKALLEYHVVYDHTLYSDAYYDATNDKTEDTDELAAELAAEDSAAKGYFHYDLPTLLKGRLLAVDIARYGRWITIKVNAFTRVVVQDGIVRDGVIHVVSDVLIPPKTGASGEAVDSEFWAGEEMSVEELIARLNPYVPEVEL